MFKMSALSVDRTVLRVDVATAQWRQSQIRILVHFVINSFPVTCGKILKTDLRFAEVTDRSFTATFLWTRMYTD